MKCLNKNLPYIQKMIQATGSEVLTSVVLDTFDDDYLPSLREVQSVINRMKKPFSEAQLDSKFKQFVSQHGINIQGVTTLDEDNVKGKVDFMAGLISLVNDEKVNESFIEEGSHVLVELLRQNQSPLYNAMYNDIVGYSLYDDVVREYGAVYNDILDASGRIVKTKIQRLREEAMGKMIASYYSNGNSAETPYFKKRTATWWSGVKAFFRDLFQITPEQYKDIFHLVSDTFKSGGFIELQPLQRSDNYLFSIDSTPSHDWSNVKAKILSIHNQLEKRLGKDEKGNEKEFYYKDGVQVKNRVTELVKKQEDSTFSEEQLKENKMKSTTGTLLHADIENVLTRYIENRNGVKNLTPKTNNIRADVYSALETFIHDLIKSGEFDGAEIFTELKIYDPARDLAGTIDLVILDKTGKAHIFDWKFTGVRVGVDGKKKTLISADKKEQWKKQMSLYRDILQKQYDIKSFGQTRMISFETTYEKGAFKSVVVDSKAYLDNVVPADEETTGVLELDKLVTDLKQQYKLLKKSSNYRDEGTKTKLYSIAKAIDTIRVKQDLSGFTKHADYDLKRIEELINAESVSDNDIRNIIAKLDFYRNLGYAINYDSTGKVQEIINKAQKLNAQFYGSDTKGGKFQVWKATNKIAYAKMQTIGTLYKFSTLQQINNPVFQMLSRKITQALDYKENRLRYFKGKFETLVKELPNGYDRLLQKDSEGNPIGTLIHQFKAEYYSVLPTANDDWLSKNVHIRDEVTVDGKKIPSKEYFEQRLAEETEYFKTADPDNLASRIDNFRKKNDFWSKDYKTLALRNYAQKKKSFFVEPASSWTTPEFKWLQDNPNSAESKLYKLFQEILADANEVADAGVAKNFIPSRNRSIIKRAVDLDVSGIKDSIVDSLTLEDYIINRDDEKTLNLILPKELYGQKDFDLASVYLDFADRVYHSKYMKDVEDVAYIGAAALEEGKFIKTNKFGNPSKSNGIVEVVDSNKSDVDVIRTIRGYEEFVDAIVYSKQDSKDIKLGTIGGKAISGKKTLRDLIDYNAMIGLGGNVLSGASNLVGAMFNQGFLSVGGNYFAKDTFSQAYAEVAKSITDDNSKAFKVMSLFDINSTSNVQKWSRKVAVDKYNKISKDIAFAVMQGGDHVTQNATLIAFLKSYTVDEASGRIIKKTEPSEKSIYDNMTSTETALENNLTLQQVNYIRNKVREINTEVTGSLSDRDKILIKQNTLGQAFSQFKTFAIPMTKARVGSLYYNSNTEEYREGRLRVATAVVFNEMFDIKQAAINLLTWNLGGTKEQIKNVLYKRYQDYVELNPNFDPKLNPETGLTFEQYLDISKANIRSSIAEVATAASIMGLTLLAAGFDDDDDEDSASQRFMGETLLRIGRELTFWFDFDSLTGFVTDSSLPVLGLVNNTIGLITNVFKEMFGLIIGDDGMVKEAKPVKKLVSITPFSKLMNMISRLATGNNIE